MTGDANSRTQNGGRIHRLKEQYVGGDITEAEFADRVEALLGGDDAPITSFNLPDGVEEITIQTRDSGRITMVAILEDAPAGQYELRRVND